MTNNSKNVVNAVNNEKLIIFKTFRNKLRVKLNKFARSIESSFCVLLVFRCPQIIKLHNNVSVCMFGYNVAVLVRTAEC